ncbi:hypothetical protein FRC12_007084 [Ceratobasidium sp. 428]|nr:hypothetical protein FRC12_007084 [Ceratobasidium sp. 428]
MLEFIKRFLGRGWPPLGATITSKTPSGERSFHNDDLNAQHQFEDSNREDQLENCATSGDSTISAPKPVRGATSINPPKSKGVTEGSDFGYTEFQYFVVDGNIYAYDYTFVVCQIDKQYYHVTHLPLDPNPPIPNTTFRIDQVSFRFDYDGELFRFTGTEWVQEQSYPILADACKESQANRHFRNTPLISTMRGLDNGLIQFDMPSPVVPDSAPPAIVPPGRAGSYREVSTSLSRSEDVPNALRPVWLLSRVIPAQQDIDDWIEAVKHGRRQHDHSDSLLLMCPLQDCNYNKELRRPQALRDHLYFHFGIKPYLCGRDGCSMAFETLANKKRHCTTCRYPANSNGDYPPQTSYYASHSRSEY